MLETRVNGLFLVNRLIDLLFAVDQVFCFFTAYYSSEKKGNRLITDLGQIRANYLRTWFLCDLLSWLPLDVVMVMQKHDCSDSGNGKTAQRLRALRGRPMCADDTSGPLKNLQRAGLLALFIACTSTGSRTSLEVEVGGRGSLAAGYRQRAHKRPRADPALGS